MSSLRLISRDGSRDLLSEVLVLKPKLTICARPEGLSVSVMAGPRLALAPTR